ncbi:IbrB-like domain-containing protein [Yersinia enterocolitica]
MGNLMTIEQLIENISLYFKSLQTEEEKVDAVNELKLRLHEASPFNFEPIDCVLWIKAENIISNDYNPNVIAPVEKRLLKHSLKVDGFTQPIVVYQEKGKYQIVDGYHRHLIGKSLSGVGKRLKGYLPVTLINENKKGKAERIATSIRHNRARGKHQITSMSDIVRELSRLSWSDEQIGKELGMDADEVLRLKQISGLTELFHAGTFSVAWTVK